MVNHWNPVMKTHKIPIAYLVNYFGNAGLENFVLSLINGLNQQIFEPHLYILIKSQELMLQKVRSGVKIQHFNKSSSSFTKIINRLNRQIKKDNIQLLESHNWGTFVEAALLKVLNPGLRLIHVQQGLEYDLTRMASARKRLFRKIFRHITTPFFDSVLGCSADTKAYLQKEWGAKDVKLIYNSIDTDQFAGVSNGKFPDKGEFNICTVGRVVPVKNYMCLFKAINLLKNDIPEIRLFHYGYVFPDKDPAPKIFSFIKENRLEKHIKLMGVTGSMHTILGSFDAFALTSLSEGLSFSLIEAQASGLPAVVTNVGGNPEVVQDGVNGFLVPSDDEKAVAKALRMIYQDKELRKKMSHNAKRLMKEKFDLRNMINSYEKIYLDILD